METYTILQHYWWFIISLLGGILVFMLFVQGGQGMLYSLSRNKEERDLLVMTLGHKWSLTFTTLVTFGGAFFASFPLFYSTSFGGAFYVWMAILLVFVIQAVGYEFRGMPCNLLGDKTYEWFLLINGWAGTFLLAVAVGTLFTGANFTIERESLSFIGGDLSVSRWQSPWKGLEAVTDWRNIVLGLTVFFLSRTLAIGYFLNAVDHQSIQQRAQKHLLYNGILFVILFLIFVISLMFSSGYGYDIGSAEVSIIPYKYFYNLVEMPIVALFFLLGVLLVLAGIAADLLTSKGKGIWLSGIGTIVTVTILLLLAGWNNTCYYPSLSDMDSSLTIANSCSSETTLTVMSYVSLLIPFVFGYIFYTWRQMNKQKISIKDCQE